jgi:hypothetical protein
MFRAIVVITAAMFASIVVSMPAWAGPACATLATMEACIQCGAAKFGYDKQVAYCRNHWKPGQKPQSFEQYRKKHPECGPNSCPIN